MDQGPRRLSGRRAQAAANDRLILEAARAVFLSDPGAPIAAVAERAGVGISALYRRYRNKEDLLQQLSLDGLRRYNAVVEAALADKGDPWTAFAEFMGRAIVVGGGSLSRRLSGTFAVTDDLRTEGVRAVTLTQQLIDRTKAAGVLRPEFEAGDFSMLSEMLQSVHIGEDERNSELKQRYLSVVLDGLRAPQDGSLPSTAPGLAELSRRYDT